MDTEQARTLEHLVKCFPKTNQFIQNEEHIPDVLISPGVDYLLDKAQAGWIFKLISEELRDLLLGLADRYGVGATRLTITSRQDPTQNYEMNITLDEIPENPFKPKIELDHEHLWEDVMHTDVMAWPVGRWDLLMQVGKGTSNNNNTPRQMLLVHLPGEI